MKLTYHGPVLVLPSLGITLVDGYELETTFEGATIRYPGTDHTDHVTTAGVDWANIGDDLANVVGMTTNEET